MPRIASRVTVDGVVTVVDGAAVAAGSFADDPEAIAAQRAGLPGASPSEAGRHCIHCNGAKSFTAAPEVAYVTRVWLFTD